MKIKTLFSVALFVFFSLANGAERMSNAETNRANGGFAEHTIYGYLSIEGKTYNGTNSIMFVANSDGKDYWYGVNYDKPWIKIDEINQVKPNNDGYFSVKVWRPAPLTPFSIRAHTSCTITKCDHLSGCDLGMKYGSVISSFPVPLAYIPFAKTRVDQKCAVGNKNQTYKEDPNVTVCIN